jgi:F-type H+-transporting ATPase subunit epsilon
VSVTVRVVTPERELWSGEATMVIARGVDGEVGILAGHIPLLVSLAVGPLRVLHDGQPERTIVVDGGFLHVTSEGDATRVDVLAERATPVEEIDVAALRARLPDLERGADTGDPQARSELERVHAEIATASARAGTPA